MADEVKCDEYVIKSKEGASHVETGEEIVLVKSMEGAPPHDQETLDSTKEEKDRKNDRNELGHEESTPEMEKLHGSGLKEQPCGEEMTYITIEIKHDDDVPSEEENVASGNNKMAVPPHPSGEDTAEAEQGRKGKKGLLNKIKEKIPGFD